MDSLISNIGQTMNTTSSSLSSKSQTVMGKDDFLMLLVEQIKAQDPLNPQDPSEFTAQLAQFSSLEQLFNLGDSMGSLNAIASSMNSAMMSSFLGREVLVSGSQMSVSAGAASSMRIGLAEPASSVKVNILNSAGQIVQTVDLGAQNPGEMNFQWDGKLASGTTAPDGVYTAQVEAKASDGRVITTENFMSGRVTGIAFANGTTMLEMDGRRIPISDILSVRILDEAQGTE